jgi:hypothetical protein
MTGKRLRSSLQLNCASMSLPVSLDAVADELDSLMDGMTAFINRKTGELYTISEDDAALVENEADEEDLPDWQVEGLPKLREILSGDGWVKLPDKFDIHEWEIMRKFSESVDDPSLANRLSHAIHGRGAFRMFRATVQDADLLEEWYAFKRLALRDIAKDALDELQVPYR